MLLTIEKLIYGGDGLARIPGGSSDSEDHGRGKAVFIPFVLAGEKIEGTVTEMKPGYARARADQLVEPSSNRVQPPCPHYYYCGGCHYQHASYEHQLQIKQGILRENLRRIARIELSCGIQLHPSPPWNYRNRSRLQVRTRPEFAAGYFRYASHHLLPVEECPISSPLINRGIAVLWESGRHGRAVEGVREIEFFANANDSLLMLEFLCVPEARRAEVRAWAEELCEAMPEIAGITAFREPQKGVQELLLSVGAPDLTYETKHAAYRVSAGAFFQTNRFLTEELADIVIDTRSGDTALDLYAGVGLFSTAIACNFRHIVSVESSPTAAKDLEYNLPVRGKVVNVAVGQYLGLPILGKMRGKIRTGKDGSSASRKNNAKNARQDDGELSQTRVPKPDFIVVDPPRAGLGDGVAAALGNLRAPRITYVSCDPSTLARDLLPLTAAGYRIEDVHLVDLFPQTFHLESVVKLVL